jgi:hypothetical protein
MTKHERNGISIEGVDGSIDITAEFEDEAVSEAAIIDLGDRAARILQAVKHAKTPENCEGTGVTINWGSKFDQ